MVFRVLEPSLMCIDTQNDNTKGRVLLRTLISHALSDTQVDVGNATSGTLRSVKKG